MGTNTENKENLRKKLKIEFFKLPIANGQFDDIFDFFYSEIDIKAQEIAGLEGVVSAYESKLSQAEELLRLAERVIDAANSRNWLIYVDALEKYESVKNKP